LRNGGVTGSNQALNALARTFSAELAGRAGRDDALLEPEPRLPADAMI